MENHESKPKELDSWQPYELDRYAQKLVIKNRNKKDVLNESHKMRMTVAYGLERFWGEQFRLRRDNQDKAQYWQDVWHTLAENILAPAGIILPNKDIQSPSEEQETTNIQEIANQLWKMNPDDRQIALMVLTQFCDCLVWWTQRYKKKSN